MEIIHRGTKPEDIIVYLQCYNCGTTAQAKAGELVTSPDQRDTRENVICPVCEKIMYAVRR